MHLQRTTIAVALAALLVGSAVGVGVQQLTTGPDGPSASVPDTPEPPTDPTDPTDPGDGEESTAAVEQFDSERSFRTYVGRSQSRVVTFRGDVLLGQPNVALETSVQADTAQSGAAQGGDGGGASGPDRQSSTNVQEVGIAEPDIVKTTGKTTFVADREYGGNSETAILNTTDPAAPEVVEEVPVDGQLLLAGDRLVIIGQEHVYGYDVSDREDPEEVWQKDLGSRVRTARLHDGQLYLVLASSVDWADPCPVYPLGADGPAVQCTDVYHPTDPAQVDATYTVARVAPGNGTTTDTVSFVGTRGRSVVYMSENAVYLTYTDSPSRAAMLADLLLEERPDLLDDQARQRIDRVMDYDLSDRAKAVEIEHVVRSWTSRQDDPGSARMRYQAALENYTRTHKRSLQRTGIVKVGVNGSLSVDAVGDVPGRPLNQFSMDEHDDHLRIATTVGNRGDRSENDVYVLDANLSVTGSVTGMGETERVYSVRFMDDEAYVVTYRRVDPFHVIDVSDPEDPTLEGELKLPGFSTYLHPVGEDRVLGIGEEDGRVKAVMFDVSDPSDPVVEESKVLDARWSAVSQSHHAFLMDRKHGVFFLPTGQGGEVFSYEGGMEHVTTIETQGAALRALYLDDYLYVVGEGNVVVVDETDWERETSVGLE